MPLPQTFAASTYVHEVMPFSQSQAGASQSAVALKLNVNAATSGALNIVGIPARFAGSIIGVRVSMTANKTAGAFSVTPTINATAITTPSTLVAVVVANSAKTANAQTTAQQTGARFAAGDLIGVKLTTDGSFAPTTNDVYVLIDVLYEDVRL